MDSLKSVKRTHSTHILLAILFLVLLGELLSVVVLPLKSVAEAAEIKVEYTVSAAHNTSEAGNIEEGIGDESDEGEEDDENDEDHDDGDYGNDEGDEDGGDDQDGWENLTGIEGRGTVVIDPDPFSIDCLTFDFRERFRWSGPLINPSEDNDIVTNNLLALRVAPDSDLLAPNRLHVDIELYNSSDKPEDDYMILEGEMEGRGSILGGRESLNSRLRYTRRIGLGNGFLFEEDLAWGRWGIGGATRRGYISLSGEAEMRFSWSNLSLARFSRAENIYARVDVMDGVRAYFEYLHRNREYLILESKSYDLTRCRNRITWKPRPVRIGGREAELLFELGLETANKGLKGGSERKVWAAAGVQLEMIEFSYKYEAADPVGTDSEGDRKSYLTVKSGVPLGRDCALEGEYRKTGSGSSVEEVTSIGFSFERKEKGWPAVAVAFEKRPKSLILEISAAKAY